MKKQRVRGFTLMELVVVMAIIGILSTVAVPNMIMWVRKSKYNTANSQAEMIFNSAQTIVQKYDTVDRSIKDAANKKLAGKHTCGNISGVTFTDAAGSELYEKIKSYFKDADRCSWAVVIDNYKITQVYYSSSEEDNYVGEYPITGDFDSYVKDSIGDKYRTANPTP